MAIEVRVPTILRTYTRNEKVVQADGTTIAEVVADLDRQYPGIADRLIDDKGLRRFVNVYLNDEGRAVRRRPGHRRGRRRFGDDSAGRRRRLMRFDSLLDSVGRTRWWGCRCCRRARTCGCGPNSRTVIRPVPSGPRRACDGRGGRGRRHPDAGRHDSGAHQRQHRHLAGDGRQGARLSTDRGDAREHLSRTGASAPHVGRRDHLLVGGWGSKRGRPGGAGSPLNATTW